MEGFITWFMNTIGQYISPEWSVFLVSSPPSGAPNSHGVTGGVYKARERIHRGMLIRDY